MNRRTPRPGRIAIGVTAALALVCVAAVPAGAVVNNPPQFPITALPGVEGVDASGYTPGEPLVVEARRGPFVLSTASGTAVEFEPATVGVLVNHATAVAPTVCWTGIVPDLVAGDFVRVVRQNGDADEMQIVDLGVTTSPSEVTPGEVTMSGFARGPLGLPLPITGLTADILSSDPPYPSNPNLRLLSTNLAEGGTGTIDYNAPGSDTWTATWAAPGLDPDDIPEAVHPDSEAGISYTGSTGMNTTTVTDADVAGADATCPARPFALPVIPTLDPASDTGAADNQTTDNTLLVTGPTGQAAPGATVSLLVDGAVVATGTVSADRTYAITTPPLSDGVHDIQMREFIDQENRTSAPVRVTVDATAPSAPVLGTNPPSGSDNNNPLVVAQVEGGTTVRLFAGAGCVGTPIGTVPAAQIAAPGVAVSVSDNTTAVFSATATDGIGNVSACSAPLSYSEVTAAPTGQVSLLGRAVTSNPAWRVRVPIGCSGPAGVICYGRLNLTTQLTVRNAAGRPVRRTVLIGSKAFAVRAGLRTTIVVQVRPRARKLIRQRGRLTARVRVVTQIGNGTTTVGRSTITVAAPRGA